MSNSDLDYIPRYPMSAEDYAKASPETRKLLAEQKRIDDLKRYRTSLARIKRQMEYVLRARESFESYTGTGLHPNPAKVRAGLLRRYTEARGALRRIIVEEGAREDVALDVESRLLARNEDGKSDKVRMRMLLGVVRNDLAR